MSDLERYWKRNLLIIATGAFLANLSFNLTTPFIPLFVEELGQTENVATLSSFAQSASALMYAIMAPVWGSLADKYGKKQMFVRAGMGIAIANLLCALSQNYMQYLILRFFNGMLSGFIPACIMFIATNTPERHVGYALGITQMGVSIGQIMGPFVGGYLSNMVGMRMAMALAALGIFIAATLCVTFSKEIVLGNRDKKTSVIEDIKSVLAVPSLRGVIFGLMLVNTALTIIQPTLTLFISSMVEPSQREVMAGNIYSIIGVSTAIGALVVSRLHRIWPPRSVFYFGLASAGALNILQGFASNVWVLGLERLIFGFSNSMITITANVLVTSASTPEMRGRTFGALNGISSLGNVVGPVIGGTLGDAMGYNIPFFAGGAFLFSAIGLTYKSLHNVGTEPIKN